jgi:hypothetical protein
MLGEWVVLFADEYERPANAEAAFALVAYRAEVDGGETYYRFRQCLTRALKRFRIEYADGPFQGTEISAVPALWLPSELVRPLDREARAIRKGQPSAGRPVYLAYYQREDWEEGNKYHLTKITLATPAEPGQAA